MFTHAHEVHSVATRSSRFASQARVARWAAWFYSAALAFAIAGALVLVVSQIIFGREPIGGPSGLVLLYLATAIVGTGLAALGRIVPISRRASGSPTLDPVSTDGSLPPEARTEARKAA
jgi:hypothetical protein